MHSEKAFETFWSASKSSASSLDPLFPEATREARAKAISLSEANIHAVFDHVQNLARAKDPAEIWRLQNTSRSFAEAGGGFYEIDRKEKRIVTFCDGALRPRPASLSKEV